MSLTSLTRRVRRKIGRMVGGFDFDQEFLTRIIIHTKGFSSTTWLGEPIWQNILDLWTIQETIAKLRPAILIETGTNRGGSSYFFAQLFDLIDHGRIVTIDVERLHALNHPRITYVIGNSTSEPVLSTVRAAVAEAGGPVMVILDSDHNAVHVAAELEAYAPLITQSSYLLVQDGAIDVLPLYAKFSSAEGGPPGPLPAIWNFLANHPEFEVDEALCNRFLITSHPSGWLRRKA